MTVGKIKLSLCLTKYDTMKTYPMLDHHAMNTHWGVEVHV
jgi:hypothetical protein